MKMKIIKLQLLTSALLCAVTSFLPAQEITIVNPLVENRIAPVGIDAPQPRFSWQLQGGATGLRQTAFQLQVKAGADDGKSMWDTGWVGSDQSHLVAYAGQPLLSSSPYTWRVRIKNETGEESPWSTPARWVTGYFDASKELTADWIGYDAPAADAPGEDALDVSQAKWICHPDFKPRERSEVWYRKSLELTDETERVFVSMELNQTGQLSVNGVELLQGGRFGVVNYLDIMPWIKPGKNEIIFRAFDEEFQDHPGLIAAIRVGTKGGTPTQMFTDESWEARDANSTAWVPVKVLGAPGDPNSTGQGQGTLFSPDDSLNVYSPPTVYLRKELELTKPIRFAVFHGTAEGLYDLHVNGKRLTETGFQPGWTQYDKFISYVSTDVTQALTAGANTIGAVLADGWFRGNLLWMGREKFGKKIRFSGQLEVEYQDGNRETFRTDPTWKAAHGAIRQSDILNGEVYDARLEQVGWDKPGFADDAWQAVVAEPRSGRISPSVTVDVGASVRALMDAGEPISATSSLAGKDPIKGVRKSLIVTYRQNGKEETAETDEPNLWVSPPGLRGADVISATYGKHPVDAMIQRAHPTDPVALGGELKPIAITQPKPGIHVFDLGQNFAGWARLKVRGTPGQSIYMRFAEDLKPDGTIYTDNLRSINPADRYICKGGGEETWEPRFTYHGFRYVEVIGLTEKPSAETLTGIVAHSSGPITSTFDSSSPMLNRLYKNIQWSQLSNFFETMTDCPQRDERFGWTGDAWFFMASSAYNQNGASFFTKWFLDCVSTQNNYNGNIRDGAPGYSPGTGNAQIDWTAALIVTPWTIWQRYGDTRPIVQNYDALRFYMTQWEKMPLLTEWEDKPEATSYQIIGDWVAIEQGTTREFIGRVLGYMLSNYMADFARIVGNKDDEKTFTDLAASYRSEVIEKHIKPDGTVDGDTQCAYAYVTNLGIYNPDQEAAIRSKFEQRMAADGHSVKTGFHGTGNLLQGLTKIGLKTDAGQTILNERSPSWGAMIQRGATTIWERWEGKDDDGNYFNPNMNSFNHYTFGGCGEWMMGDLIGLRPYAPGFKTVLVEPAFIPGLNHADGSFESPYGKISNKWKRSGGQITMRLSIPPNSDAQVVLPTNAKSVTFQGKKISGTKFKTGSGIFIFQWVE